MTIIEYVSQYRELSIDKSKEELLAAVHCFNISYFFFKKATNIKNFLCQNTGGWAREKNLEGNQNSWTFPKKGGAVM